MAARDVTAEAARDAYLSRNGFTVSSYDDAWTHASFFALDFAVPNTERHRWAIMLHDLHHVATGFGTDLAGEAEISAWELRGGLDGLGLYVGSIVLAGAAMGLLVAPLRTLAAWRAAKGARSLWSLAVRAEPGRAKTYEDLLKLDVAALRALVGAPERGVARQAPGRHKNAPTSLSPA